MKQAHKLFTFINSDRDATVASRVQIAGTSQRRRRGLLGRTAFDEIAGLWIIPCEAIHTFGMKIALDSIFLDKNLKVRSLRSGLKPGRIAICLRAHSVLEVPVGAIAASGTLVGDRLECLGLEDK